MACRWVGRPPGVAALLAMVDVGPGPDEWGDLEQAYQSILEVFGG